MDFLKKNKSFIFISTLLTLFNVCMLLVTPLLLMNMNSKEQPIDKQTLGWLVVCMFLSFVIQLALVFVRENYSVSFNVTNGLDFFKNMFEMTYQSLQKLEPSYLVNRILDSVDHIYLFVTSSLVNLVGNSLLIGISLFLFWRIDLFTFLLMLIILPLNFFSYKLINKKLQKLSKRMAEENATSMKEILSLFKNIDTVKQEATFDSLEALVAPSLHAIFSTMAATNKYARGTSLSIELVNNFIQTIMSIWLAIGATQNIEQLPNLVIANVLFPLYFVAIKSFTSINLDYKNLQVTEQFIENDLLFNKEPVRKSNLATINNIAMDDVHVTVQDKTLDFSIHQSFVPGDIVYVEGASGTGKSTLMKALLHFLPSTGITINEQPLDSINPASLRQRVGFCSQETLLLPTTIKKNVLFGRKDNAIEWERIENSSLLQPILATKSFDTNLYESGANLSGGEKQRISLARLLLEKHDVLILDEVTSNIDKDSSDHIMTTLLDQTDCIIFMISHDKSNKDYCNKTIQIHS